MELFISSYESLTEHLRNTYEEDFMGKSWGIHGELMGRQRSVQDRVFILVVEDCPDTSFRRARVYLRMQYVPPQFMYTPQKSYMIPQLAPEGATFDGRTRAYILAMTGCSVAIRARKGRSDGQR